MKKEILLGNEALVQGALEAGVSFVSGYPGCPSAEIGEGLAKFSKEYGIYTELSTNEKVALEAGIGASFSGLKTLVHMKSFGINVCSDSLFPLAYTGTKAGFVLVVADDPSCWSSAQSEQDSRGYAYLSHIPVLEPSDPQEARDFTKLAFEISEKFNTPVILRITTRVAHQRMSVEFEELKPRAFQKGEFVKDYKRFATMPPRVLEMKKELLEKIEKIRQFSEKSLINKVEPLGDPFSQQLGIIASGVSYLYVKEAMQELGLNLPVLKLGLFYPLPEKKIKDFIKNLKKVLVVEELDPYIEREVRALNGEAEIFGKDILPEIGELNQEKVIFALSKILKLKIKDSFHPVESEIKFQIPARLPQICQNCPYWIPFTTLKKFASPDVIFGGDIGCNMIAGLPPHNIHDYLFSMGSSIGIGHGIEKATSQKVVALIGDGTFFHAGIPALINAVYNKSNLLVFILDNYITAMTGHQQNPGTGKNDKGEEAVKINIEDIVKACGVKNLKIVDPVNIKEIEETIKEFLDKEEVSVIISRKICYLLEKRNKKHE